MRSRRSAGCQLSSAVKRRGTMGTRILWQAENRSNDADFEGVTETYAAMLKFAHQVARPDTEITLRYIEEAPRSFANNLIYPRAVTKVQVVNRVVEAEREGFDAALAGVCIIDAYSQECRQTVRMPVLGGAESTMLMAQLVGKRFAWVTIATASSSPSNGISEATGPKISSRATRMRFVTPANTVGSTK
ncbi:aspartate/glutamate racemase family protein [Burkholderia multivorans]|uniref:aspartate/glutamate racemase family protein n=1 Tax=Burkholderia multivorans TaxID=87883 RepID=UPI0035BE557A